MLGSRNLHKAPGHDLGGESNSRPSDLWPSALPNIELNLFDLWLCTT